MKWLPALLLLTTSAFAASPTSVNNDDTCDVKVGPAATLLLPYFEVDVNGTSGQTTLFTVTNVSRYPQIAHVTLWTDRAYPVLTFNLFLTGYDVQAINLADVLVRSVVASPSGIDPTAKPGLLSAASSNNLRAANDCAGSPGTMPASIGAAIRTALTTGSFAAGTALACDGVGNAHTNAIGYATIDVVASCTSRAPNDPLYFSNDLLFDNVLIGDYQNLGPHPAGEAPSSFDATGNPMVHIRAIPEGGGAGSNVATALPYTFYDRYTPTATRIIDRRQPLPSTFAARFIQGGQSNFRTNLTIWRESIGIGSCTDVKVWPAVPVAEIVRFDEHENPFTFGGGPQCDPTPCNTTTVPLPATSSTSSLDTRVYPPIGGTDVGGWLYINLNNGGSTTYSVTRDVGGQPTPTNARTNFAPAGSTTNIGPRHSQNWVTISMFGNLTSRGITAEFDAASLANGCTPAAFITLANSGTGVPIAPGGGVFVCPPGTSLTDGSIQLCTGTNVNPQP